MEEAAVRGSYKLELHETKYEGKRRARVLEVELLVLVLVGTRGDLVTGRPWNAAEGDDLTSIPVRRTRGGHAGTYVPPALAWLQPFGRL